MGKMDDFYESNKRRNKRREEGLSSEEPKPLATHPAKYNGSDIKSRLAEYAKDYDRLDSWQTYRREVYQSAVVPRNRFSSEYDNILNERIQRIIDAANKRGMGFTPQSYQLLFEYTGQDPTLRLSDLALRGLFDNPTFLRFFFNGDINRMERAHHHFFRCMTVLHMIEYLEQFIKDYQYKFTIKYPEPLLPHLKEDE